MHKLLSMLLSLSLLVIAGSANGQSINPGRGELPLKVPADYDASVPTPLIVLLHGYGSSGARQDAYLGVSKLVDRYGFLFVAPDGNREKSADQSSFWNASSACCDFYQSKADDSTYVEAIIDAVKADYNVDPARVFLIGHSNGGFLSYRVAYEHSDTIAAIASLAGANEIADRPAPNHPVHVLQIHGTEDGTIAYNGDVLFGNRYPSAMETVQRWASYNGCATTGAQRELRDLEATIDGYESTVVAFKEGCKAGGSSELWTIAGGSHIPKVSDSFSAQVVEWLYAHPKLNGGFAD